MSKNYENQILDAIQTLVDNAVDKAKYDKTIKGIVSKCTDQSKGEYVIKYQDSSFYAYSNDLEQIYNSGTPVYVLVPGNDMAQTKTIIGSVNKLGSDYITIRDNANDYQIVGNSVISNNNEFGVCSYTPNGDAVVLYDKVNSISLIDINIFAANAYLKQSGQLIVGGQFKTALDNEQKYKGNYGLGFKLAFTDPTTGEDVSRTYLVDINSMTGSPYNYTNGSEQKVIFDIDGENFKEIELITLFCYDFPNTTSDSKPDDIFVSNIILCGANALSEDEKGGNALTLITPQGIYFDNNDLSTASREITAELRIDNRLITANSDVLQYYWFRENPKINSSSEKYNRYGGNGWECLNSFNNLGNNDADEPIIDWLSAQATYTTTKANNSAKETDYKCVVVYNKELVLSKVLTIFNYSSAYTINITSDSGMYFSYNNGKPTLTATINGSAPSTYEYKWSVIDNNNRFTPIEETTDINTPYHTAQNRYDEIKEGLADGSILLTADIQTELSTLMYDLHQYEKTMRVEDNVIYNLNLSTVTNFSIFSCAVYDSNDVYLGKGKIEIVNDINAGPNAYTLVVNNGDQVFKYNEQGVSPTSKSLENPQEIYPLSFTLYDENGLEISNDLISANDVSWTVPTTDTMINVSDVHGNPSEIDTLNETKTYTGYKELYFTIPVLFSANKTRNTVELKVKYKNKIVIIKKELTFIKEGEVGTNGTNFVCKVLPNVIGTAEIPKYVIYRYNNTTSTGSLNYTPGGEGLWFKAYLYKDGVEIFNGTVSGLSTENKSVTVKWEMLVNKYDSTHSDASNFAVNNGLFSFVTANKDIDNPANIARCVLTYEGQTYYATVPIIYVNAAAAYKAEPIENTGFQYAMYTTDGVRPIYDNSNPFALKITQTVNNEDIDISIATEAPYALDDYDWNAEGQVYVGTEWVPQTNLIRRTVTLTDLAKNEAKFYPIEKFDGFCVNNGLVCQISRNSTNLLKIHLPIHLYLNRYGNSALNGWDGNHIEINDDGGFILAPQIGAGKKEQDNSYTGVFMGSVREAGSNGEEVGLFGYKSGVRTLELNAEDGSARFGKQGAGRIIIDPGTGDYDGKGTARLYSDDYSITYTKPNDMVPAQTKYLAGFSYWRKVNNTEYKLLREGIDYTIGSTIANTDYVWNGGAGLEIDLNDPHIRFGSGKFRVDSDGQVYATGFVTVNNLEAGDYNIPSGSIDVGSDNNLNDYMSTTNNTLANLQSQIDGAIQFWNGQDVPLPSSQYSDWSHANYPASDWTTESERINHQADIYTVIEDVQGEWKQGKSYRFDKVEISPGVERWIWIELTDQEMSAVQALAASKAKVFIKDNQHPNPTPPYSIGDMWFADGDMYTCINAKDNTGSYAASDWELATDYTDDTAVNVLKQNVISEAIVQYALGDDAETAPTTGWAAETPVWTEGKYVWQRTVTTYADNTQQSPHVSISDPVCIQGAKGEPGTNGKSIVVNTTTITYQNSTNGTTIPTGTWTSSPSPEEGKYTWTRTITTYKLDGTSTSAGSSTSYSVAYTGPKGDQGRSLVKQTPLHYLKSNDTAPVAPTSHVTSTSTEPGIWTTAMPEYVDGYTYFACSENEFNEAPLYEWTNVVKDNGLNDALIIANQAKDSVDELVDAIDNPTNTILGQKYFDIDDAAEKLLIDFKMYGETQQEQTTQGKNLFDINGKIISGTITKYNNGFTLIKGTNRTLTIALPNKHSAGTYSLSCNIITNTLSNINKLVFAFRLNGTTLSDGYVRINSSGKGTLTTTSQFDGIYIYIENTESDGVQITLDNVQLEVGSSATTYEAFVPNSPSPNYPQPIHNVSGDNTIEICGKNLFNDYRTTTLTPGGLTISGVEDGVEVNGTFNRTANIDIWLTESRNNNYNNLILLEANTTYTINVSLASGTFTSNYNITCALSSRTADENKTFNYNYQALTQNGNVWSVTFTTGDSNIYGAGVRFTLQTNRITTFNNAKFQIQLEKGSTSSEYESYTGNSQLISLGVENLFDKDNANILNNAYLNNSQSKIASGNGNKVLYISIEGGKTYTISKIASSRFAVATTSTLPSIDTTTIDKEQDNSATHITLNTSINAKYLCVFYLYSSDTITEQQVLDSIQIEKGSKANSYSPYGASYIELNKISTYQDYIYKDNDRWYLHKEIGKVVLNGSESWNISSNDIFYTPGSDILQIPNIITTYSTYLQGYYNQPSAVNVYKYNIDNSICASSSSASRFYIKATKFTTLKDFKTWLSTHNTTIYYVLSTPTDTEITDTTLLEQLNRLMTLPLYKNMTHITLTANDLNPNMDIEYIKDNVINNNFVTSAEMGQTKEEISNIQEIADAAYGQAQSTLISYTTTDTANLPGDNATWVNVLPSAPDKYIWQRIEYKFLDSSRDYFTQPTCLYTPTRVTNELQYCLCSQNNYDNTKITNDWQSEPFPWDDSYATSASPTEIEILRYQFIRNKYTDTNKTEDAISYSTPILDQAWYMFGRQLASEKVSRQILENNINNSIVTINNQDGITISSADSTYGIRLTSVGLRFLINGTWTTVWNIDGTLDANLITVKDLRADNILSGTLTLSTTDNNGSFILNSTYGESTKIDGNGVKVTTSDGATVHIKTGGGEGISAKTQTNVEYFNTDPDTQKTTMTNGAVTNECAFGTHIKVVQITNGIAFIGI